MLNKEQQGVWDDIKEMWNASSNNTEINIAMSELVAELKNKTTQFERNTIKKDVEFIKRNTSQFEKDAIKKDIEFFKRNTDQFEKNSLKSIKTFFTRMIKRLFTKEKND